MRKQKQLTKKLMGFLLTLVMICTLIPLAPQTVKAASDGFYISGTSVYDANGNKFVMRGVNIAHAWYTSETDTSIKAAASKGANCVRIVCSNGKQYTKTSASELQHIIDVCKQNKVVCIVEVHDATGSDSTSDLNAAVDYWKEMKSILSANKKYVIVNIANEWYGTWNGSAWASGYKTAIKNMRNAGIHNLLMVDCAGWGQYPDSIKDYGKSVIQADSDNNIMFSIHMYEYAGSDANTVRTNIDNALATGAPLTIGEFGFKHTNGDVDEYTIMQYSQQKGVGYMGWSWKGNGDTWNLQILSTAPVSLIGETLYSMAITVSAKLPRHVPYLPVLPAVLPEAPPLEAALLVQVHPVQVLEAPAVPITTPAD